MDQNQQLLNTILTTVIAGLSFAVTFLAYLAARTSNKISQRSIEIQKAENKPVFKVISSNENFGPAQISENFLIKNEGAPVKIDQNNYRLANFLEITVYGTKKFLIPISSKYCGHEYYRNQTGDLIKISASNMPTYTKALQLIYELQAKDKNIQAFPVSYLNLPYTNIYDEKCSFIIKYSWHSVDEITMKEFEEKYKQYEQFMDKERPKPFIDIDVEDLMKYIMTSST